MSSRDSEDADNRKMRRFLSTKSLKRQLYGSHNLLITRLFDPIKNR